MSKSKPKPKPNPRPCRAKGQAPSLSEWWLERLRANGGNAAKPPARKPGPRVPRVAALEAGPTVPAGRGPGGKPVIVGAVAKRLRKLMADPRVSPERAGKAIGVTRNAVSVWCLRNGVKPAFQAPKPSKPRPKPKSHAKVHALAAKGVSASEIARRVGLSRPRVSQLLLEARAAA